MFDEIKIDNTFSFVSLFRCLGEWWKDWRGIEVFVLLKTPEITFFIKFLGTVNIAFISFNILYSSSSVPNLEPMRT